MAKEEKEPNKVAIIYCKDCKNYKEWQGRKVCTTWFHTKVDEQGYCYKAERK